MSKHHTLIMLRQARSTLLKNKLSGSLTAGLLAHIKHLDAEIAADQQQAQKHAELMRVGKCAADSLRCMVAALECDYDRLEELRDSRDGYHITVKIRDINGEVIDNEDVCDTEESKKEWIKFFADDATELAELESAAGECTSREDAEQRIQDDALSVEVRSEWHSPGDANGIGNGEFQILLSTGGPASRIMGELRDGEPHRAWLEVQDWGTSWTHYHEEGLSDVLLSYARCWHFGE